MKFCYKKTYLKRFDRFAYPQKELVISADKEIRNYYVNHCASYGLRIKKLYDNGKDKVLEARVSADIRILWVESEDSVVFSLLGSHDEVRKYLKDIK